MSARSELRRFYAGNIKGARAFGAWWAIDDYTSGLRHLDEHPRGPLTARMQADARRFGIRDAQGDSE